MKDFDLIVVGAGPAGSSAALTAAREGLSVLLVEEHPRVGIPLQCAEGLSRSTVKNWLNIEPEWIAVNLSGSIIRGPTGEEFRIEYPNVGWILNRKIFDSALAENAVKMGAVLKTSARVIGIENNTVVVNENGSTRRYNTGFIIGADGINSRVGEWLGIDTRLKINEIEVCAEYFMENIKIEPHYTYLIFDNKIAPGGYAWIFPKSANSANVGLGISPLKTRKKAKHYLDEWIKTEFPEGVIKEKIFGGVPAKILKKFSGENFFLVGDAARFTDPLSGAGIANGIKSGIIAGRNAALRLKGKRDFFEKEIEKEILSEIKFHKKVRDIYLRLSENDYKKIFEIGKNFFANKTITDINTREIIGEVIKNLPSLLPLCIRLLF
ncbi:MAG: NAD(P)/FAD-dependent oxidoreductase [candidate division WOR-3 bacterium]|nr:NAD(P)/FAD-dependent oxidoreductase [candidate division WOR-3 bacterium]